MAKSKNIKVGDIFQILTSKGVCYGQIINTHQEWKYIVAIFREFFSKEPSDFTTLVLQEPQLITAFLIDEAVKQGLFKIVDNVPVDSRLSEFPIFRGTNNLKGDDTIWWFWDGINEWKVDRELTESERKYPEGPTLLSAPLLIELIEKDYRVERDYI